MPADSYVLGRPGEETQRLRLQSWLYAAHTEHLLRMAGIGPGMRVLDVGCGLGDVTFLAAQLVGSTGQVVGVDIDGDLLALARDRAAESVIGNVSFVQAEIPDIPMDGPVDAIIGRLILIHLPDPAGAVRALRSLLRPGGIVSFQDFGVGHSMSARSVPLAAESSAWCFAALRAAGHPLLEGEGIVSIFRDAGLAVSGIAGMNPATCDPDSPMYDSLGGTVASLLPVMIAKGIATEAEVGIRTLVDRMRAEGRETGSVFYLPELIGVWAKEGMDRA